MLFTTAVNHALSRFGLHERVSASFPRQPSPMLVVKAATLFDDPKKPGLIRCFPLSERGPF